MSIKEAVLENGNGNGRGRARVSNAMEMLFPLRNVLGLLLILGSLFGGGLKLEQYILESFSEQNLRFSKQDSNIDMLSQRLVNIDGLLVARAPMFEELRLSQNETSRQITNILSMMQTKGAVRDQQIDDINKRIGDLGDKVDRNTKANNDAIDLLNARLGNIVNDIATMKCQMSRKC